MPRFGPNPLDSLDFSSESESEGEASPNSPRSANFVESYNANSINTANRFSLISTNSSTPTPATPVLSSTPAPLHREILNNNNNFSLTHNTPLSVADYLSTPNSQSIDATSPSPLLISLSNGTTTMSNSLFRSAHHLQPHTPLLSALQNLSLLSTTGQVTTETNLSLNNNINNLNIKPKERSIFTAPAPTTATTDAHQTPKLSASAPVFVPNFMNLAALPVAAATTLSLSPPVTLPFLPSSATDSPVLLAPLLAKAYVNQEVAEAQAETEVKTEQHNHAMVEELRVNIALANELGKAKNSPSKSRASPNKTRQQISYTLKKSISEQMKTMGRLNQFNELVHMASSDSYVILDLDETVYLNKYQPCEMMKEKGLLLYQSTLANHSSYKHLNFVTKTRLTKTLQIALQSKRPVENDTIATIHAIQQRGIAVFALTARYSHMAAVTKKELASLGLDLTVTSPFAKDAVLHDQETEASYDGGVIFTNACEKGPVLDRFLHNLFGKAAGNTHTQKLSAARSLFAQPKSSGNPTRNAGDRKGAVSSIIASASSPFSATPPASVHSRPVAAPFAPPLLSIGNDSSIIEENESEGKAEELSASSSFYLPEKIIFLDDRLQNCVSVLNGLSVAERLRIAICTYHYQPACHIENEADPNNPPSASDLAALAEFQIHHFINTQQLLDDHQAKLVKSQHNGDFHVGNNLNPATLSRPSSRAATPAFVAMNSGMNANTPITPSASVVPVSAIQVNQAATPTAPDDKAASSTFSSRSSAAAIPLFELLPAAAVVNHSISHSSAKPIPIPVNNKLLSNNNPRYNAAKQPRQQKYSAREFHLSHNHNTANNHNKPNKAIVSQAS
jgi:hypothetical protein